MNDQKIGILTLEAILTPQGQLRGKWETTIGTGGTFNAFPHDFFPVHFDSITPEQIHAKNIDIDSIRLFMVDIKQLFNQIKKDFTSSRLIVTYNINYGSEITKYEEDFLKDAQHLDILNYLRMHIQEIESNGIARTVTIELRAHGANSLRVQGVQESWVIGKAEGLAIFLKKYKIALITAYKKFGLNIGALIFMAMLVIIPSINSTIFRGLFVLFIFLLLQIFVWVHSRFIPNAYICMKEKKPIWLERYWPNLVSWGAGIASTVIAGLIYYWIMKAHL